MRSNYTQIHSPVTRMLSSGQIEEIYAAALETLEYHGSLIKHDGAKKMLLEAGATEGEKGRILIPAAMVESAIQTAPKRIKLYDRDGNENMNVGGYHSYFGSICDAVDIIDPYTGERRPCVSSDWINIAKVMDYLPNLSFMHICGNANDMNPYEAYREVGYVTMPNCRKTIVLSMGDTAAFEELIELAEVIAGGSDAFKRKPNIFCILDPITPLKHAEDSLERLLLCAEKRAPVTYFGMQMQGVTSPATGTGTLVVALAESLAGLVIHQLKNPGAPFILGGIPGVMDMKTMVFSYGSPELTRNLLGMADVAHYLELPFLGTTSTDAKRADAQCGTEFALSSFAAILSGQNLIHDCAQLDQALLTSLQAAALNDEVIGMCRVIMNGLRVDEEELAVDVIGKVGAGGNFLSQKHTTKRYKDFWMPTVFDRSSDWTKVKPMEERMDEKIRYILENHEVSPLPEDKLKAIRELKEKWNKKRNE